MARKGSSPRAQGAGLPACCRDIDEWPERWKGFPEDIAPGKQLVECFRPFIEHMVAEQLSPKTLRKHVSNIWMLGGEIIRDLDEDPKLRKVPLEKVLRDAVRDGGPLPYHYDSEEELRSFESTCRRFERFLEHKEQTGKTAARRRRT